jgi:hypothetical protein
MLRRLSLSIAIAPFDRIPAEWPLAWILAVRPRSRIVPLLGIKIHSLETHSLETHNLALWHPHRLTADGAI